MCVLCVYLCFLGWGSRRQKSVLAGEMRAIPHVIGQPRGLLQMRFVVQLRSLREGGLIFNSEKEDLGSNKPPCNNLAITHSLFECEATDV